jgi:hypothetical protein
VVSTDGDTLMIRLHDEASKPYAQAVDYQFTLGDAAPSAATSPDGWVAVPLPNDSCPDHVHIEWGPKAEDGTFPFAEDIFIAFDDGDDRAQSASKLSNLGYVVETDDQYQQAVVQFQQDYALTDQGLGSDGRLPSQTHDKLWSLFNSDCDATCPDDAPQSTPPPSSGPASQDATSGAGTCF